MNLFRTLRTERAKKSSNAGNTKVPNLQEPLVEVRVHGGSKRKASILVQQGVGKDLKKVRFVLLESESTRNN